MRIWNCETPLTARRYACALPADYGWPPQDLLDTLEALGYVRRTEDGRFVA